MIIWWEQPPEDDGGGDGAELLPAGLPHGLPGVQPVPLPHPPPPAQAVLSAPGGLKVKLGPGYGKRSREVSKV